MGDHYGFLTSTPIGINEVAGPRKQNTLGLIGVFRGILAGGPISYVGDARDAGLVRVRLYHHRPRLPGGEGCFHGVRLPKVGEVGRLVFDIPLTLSVSEIEPSYTDKSFFRYFHDLSLTPGPHLELPPLENRIVELNRVFTHDFSVNLDPGHEPLYTMSLPKVHTGV